MFDRAKRQFIWPPQVNRLSFVRQFKSIAPILITVYLFLLFVFWLLAYANHRFGFNVEYAIKDPAHLYNGHPLVGFLSNVGILLWCSASAICLFLGKLYSKYGNPRVSRFYFYSGLLSAVLLIDDFFMVHDFLFRTYFDLSQDVLYVMYIGFAVFVFVKFFDIIIRTEYLILALACVFLGLSTAVDTFFHNKGVTLVLVEDGAKTFGIATWFLYYVRTGYFSVLELSGHQK